MNVISLALAVSLAFATAAFAQQERPDPAADARIRVGPFGFTPALGLTNLGIDNNVFNEVTSPKRDVTSTVTPSVDTWFRMGRARFNASNRVDLVYFAKYGSESSVNTRHSFGVQAPLRTLRPFASARLTSARERPGFEIDARSRRRERRLAVGNEFRLSAKTAAAIELSGNRIRFDADAIFDGTYLSEVLNRSEDALRFSVRHELTPLTTVRIAADLERNRFDHSVSVGRDTDALRVLTGVELAPSALISGNVEVGFRKSRSVSGTTPMFNGLVGHADVAYVLLGATRLSLRMSRDRDYSYDGRWPYYVSTGTSITIHQRIATAWDAQVTVGRQGLAYRTSDLVQTGRQRRDRIASFGVGTGYRVGPTSRLVFSVDHFNRDSELPLHAYSGLQSGLSLAYGF